jgi:hypothetical protein
MKVGDKNSQIYNSKELGKDVCLEQNLLKPIVS